MFHYNSKREDTLHTHTHIKKIIINFFDKSYLVHFYNLYVKCSPLWVIMMIGIETDRVSINIL